MQILYSKTAKLINSKVTLLPPITPKQHNKIVGTHTTPLESRLTYWPLANPESADPNHTNTPPTPISKTIYYQIYKAYQKLSQTNSIKHITILYLKPPQPLSTASHQPRIATALAIKIKLNLLKTHSSPKLLEQNNWIPTHPQC
eukprot:gene13210-9056_t